MNQELQSKPIYHVSPIGYVHTEEQMGKFEVHILPDYRDALQKLEQFSHVNIVWWADKEDEPEKRKALIFDLPYATGTRAGAFACRSQQRPNPIAITTMPIMGIDHEQGIVALPWIDAFDGTPVLDLKPYMPTSDRVRDAHGADWMKEWPMWMEEAGAFFAEHETDFGD